MPPLVSLGLLSGELMLAVEVLVLLQENAGRSEGGAALRRASVRVAMAVLLQEKEQPVRHRSLSKLSLVARTS